MGVVLISLGSLIKEPSTHHVSSHSLIVFTEERAPHPSRPLVKVRRDTITMCASSVEGCCLAKVRSNPQKSRQKMKSPGEAPSTNFWSLSSTCSTWQSLFHFPPQSMQQSMQNLCGHPPCTSPGLLPSMVIPPCTSPGLLPSSDVASTLFQV